VNSKQRIIALLQQVLEIENNFLLHAAPRRIGEFLELQDGLADRVVEPFLTGLFDEFVVEQVPLRIESQLDRRLQIPARNLVLGKSPGFFRYSCSQTS
jgi:hypothetical protein